jgi:hypothetical protein
MEFCTLMVADTYSKIYSFNCLGTSHRTYLTIAKTRKGRPRPDPGCCATDDDELFGCLVTENMYASLQY